MKYRRTTIRADASVHTEVVTISKEEVLQRRQTSSTLGLYQLINSWNVTAERRARLGNFPITLYTVEDDQ